MAKRRVLLAVLLAAFFSFFVTNSALAAGILGFQTGDRSPEDNDAWLLKGVTQIQMAIKEADEGNGEKSVEHGAAGLAAMKEINSEGWAGTLERSVKSIRHGVSAAKKGNLEKASLDYQIGLEKLGNLKFGDMNFTHESFLGIGDRR